MKVALRTVALATLVIVGGVACDAISTGVENTAPEAVASAPISPSAGSVVTLDGTGSSDADGDQLTFSWTLVSQPGGSSATLSNASSAQATFTADAVGTFTAVLEVSDGTDSDADTVDVNVVNAAPTASALPTDTVAAGDQVTLDGSASSANDANQTLTYSWTLEVPTGSSAALSSASAVQPTFTTDVTGDYRAILTVNDGFAAATDTAVILAIDPGQPPVINSTATEGNIASGVPHLVQVDASDPEGNPLTYSWSQLSGPGTVTFDAASTDSTDLEASAPGAYAVEIAVSDGFNVVTDTMNFQAFSPVWPGTIGADTTIVKLLNSDYTAEQVTVTAGLTLRPGVVVRFAEFDRLIIDTGGFLNAVGVASDSIRFLGSQGSAGWWDGIEIRTVNASNEIAFAEVAHGGDGGYSNVYVSASGEIAIHDSRIHTGSGFGVEVISGGSIEGFANNTLRNNAAGAVELPAGAVGALDNGSSYGNLAADRVVIAGGTATTAATWPAIDVPYLVADNTTLQATITVEPGAEFRVNEFDRIIIDTGGALKAVGTASDSIRFLGSQASAGWWDGIEIKTVSADNQLVYTEVAHAGDGGWANVWVTGSGSVTVNNSRIHDGATAGVHVVLGGALAGFSQNTFADNAGGAVSLPLGNLGQLDNASAYGAGSSGLFIEARSGPVTTAQTWPKTDVPVRLAASEEIQAAVTVEAGFHMQGMEFDRLTVAPGGSLNAIGTSTDSIRFVGLQNSYGYWDGIEIQSNSPDNQFHYAHVANGGSGGYSNIYVTGSGQVELANSVFRRSSEDGVEVLTGGQLVNFSTNAFEDNQGSAIRVPAEELGQLDAASTYAGGNTSEFITTEGTASSAATWPSTDAPILMTGNTTITGAITVANGADFRFAQFSRLIVDTGGTLDATSVSTDTITFLGQQGSAGWWDGIEVRSTGNTFDYVNVGHGGSGGYANIYIANSGEATVSNSFIHDSSTWGIDTGGTYNNGGGNTFSNNANGPTGT